MKWILLLAIIVIIQYGEVAGYPPKMIFENLTPIEHTPADRNKLKSPESNCEYCYLNDIISAAYEEVKKKEPTVDMFGNPVTFRPFEDIFLPPKTRSSRRVELTQYLSNSFNVSLAEIKEYMDVLETRYKVINEILQETDIYEILLTKQSSKFFLHRLLSKPWIRRSVPMYQWTKILDDDIDYIKNNLGLLKTDYERVIDNLKKIEATREKEQQTDHMFVNHGLFFNKAINDMIQSRSTRLSYLTNLFNSALAFIRITLDSLEMRYEYINRLLQKAKANEEKGKQTDQISLIEESYIVRTASTVDLLTLSHFKHWFDNDIANIEGNLELLKHNVKLAIDNLKEFMDLAEANSQKDEKDPSPSESIVSNNNTQENVTQTIPTPDKSTYTQKLVPIKHDDKKDKLVGEKDPLHTPEIAPNNKTSENVIIPIESTIIEKLALTTV